MEHDAFIGQVQHRARLASRGDAERAVRATLETLGQRLAEAGDVAENVAAQLPSEIGYPLRTGAKEPFERFGLKEFFSRVNRVEGGTGQQSGPGSPGVDMPASAYHARVVIEVMEEALSGGTIDKVRQVLPQEFGPLFEAGSQGEMRRSNA